MMQTVLDNATWSAGAVVRQQVMQLQQQLADLQSSFMKEQRKATRVMLSHHLVLATTSLYCFFVAAGWS